MNADRDRTWLAATEIAIAIGMMVSQLLPWWQVTPTTADRIPTGPSYTVGMDGASAGGTEASLFVMFGPWILLVFVLLAAWLSRRGLIVLSLIGFLSIFSLGAMGEIHLANFDLVGTWPTRPYLGLELFALLSLAGTIVTAIDLARDGRSTALSRQRQAAQG